MVPGQILPGQMSRRLLESVLDFPKSLHLKFGMKKIQESSKSEDRVDITNEKQYLQRLSLSKCIIYFRYVATVLSKKKRTATSKAYISAPLIPILWRCNFCVYKELNKIV